MKRRLYIYPVLILLFIAISLQTGFAQSGGILDILYTNSSKDASRYSDQFFEPIFKGLGYGFNNGWYNTAKPHKSLGFDLTFSINLAYVPAKDEFFTFDNQDYNFVQLANGNQAEAPTIFGPDEPGPALTVTGSDINNGQPFTFNGVNGAGLKDEIGFNAIPSPTLQLGVGLIKNTDLKIRYVPDVAREDVDYSIWGIGIMHDVGQWIPVINQVPIDISIFAGYSSMNADVFFEPVDEFPGANQQVSTSIKGFTIEALVSKKISVITFLAGIGYNKARANFDLLGTYNFYYPMAPSQMLTLTDPIAVDSREGSLRATAGLRLQLAIFTLHGNYTFNGYNMLNVGFGFSFR